LQMKGEDRRPPGGGKVGDGDRGGRGGGVSGVGKRMKEEAGSGRMGGVCELLQVATLMGHNDDVMGSRDSWKEWRAPPLHPTDWGPAEHVTESTYLTCAYK